ncbi:TIGR04086 family membrane protein [Acutalibacter caecimuris]|uniref:TIGR04086 family membrane protein n=1 Tax=Acutalibacter caecimuris TaxID=3093657 RepID=UPI002AC9E531|nr:TIGR04086 family membrane protein [Acutalibacter sp. M00118]
MKWVKALILSSVLTAAVSMLLLSVAAFVVCRSGSLPRGALPLITTLIACGAVFLSGFFTALSMREKGLLLGLAAGLVFLLCAGLVTFLLFQGQPGPASAGKGAAVLLSGAIGGILGANRKQKVKF